MKKIMFVCNGVSIGGAERVVSLLADSLIKDGNEVYLLAFLRAKESYKLNPNIKVIYADKVKNDIKNKINRISAIRKNIILNNIDVVISFSHYNVISTVIASIGINVKIIGSERNDPAQINNRKFLKTLRDITYKKLDCLVCQTQDAKEYFSPKIQEKTKIILNPISDNLPLPYEGIRRKRIVSFLRFEPQKNIPMLIDAFKKLHMEYNDYVLELYGEGSEKENIINYVKDKNLTKCVNIYPFTTDIHKKVIDAEIFALASDYEGLSNSMLEAMAMGLPTIVTDCPCGGARMVIKNGINGYLVPVGDVEALYKRMKYLIQNKEHSEYISKNSIVIREELNKERIAKQWISVINNIT